MHSVLARLPHRLQVQHSPNLAALTPAGWHLVEVGSVLAQPFSLDAVEKVTGQPLGELGPALGATLAAKVIMSTAAGFVFCHELVRQAICQQVPEDTRMALYRRIEAVESEERGSVDTDRHASPVLERPATGSELPAAPRTLVGWMTPGDLDSARTQAQDLLGGARGGDSDGTLADAFSSLAYVAWNQGRIADAIGLQEAAIRRAGPAGVSTSPFLHFGLATIFTATGDFSPAHDATLAMAAVVRASGRRSWAAGPVLLRARLALAAGRATAAAADAQLASSALDDDETVLFGSAGLMVLAVLAVRRGELDEAGALVDRFSAQPADSRVLFGRASEIWAAGLLAEARDGASAALEVLAPLYDDPAAHKRLFMEESTAAPWLVQTALGAGELVAAERVAACAELLAAANWEYPSIVGSAAHARALLTRDPTTLERLGVEHLTPAARAAACEDAGELLAHGGNRSQARVQLERALAGFEHLTASRDQARVHSRLASLGSRSRRSRHGLRPVSGWGSLTDAETRVADLVASGLSNPQVATRLYLSRHTVDFHLRQVFRKLNITSRVELTRLSLERTMRRGDADSRQGSLT
ncbi:MAG TPA: helix-turn-helix transcriptional regulator [Acidimicrobiales bacterium]|jgi:DNA-binding CsgD family transcriptional regulator|nr:helix-turn-helix transcriptional regulator [Acidimicrobiales bacterium]